MVAPQTAITYLVEMMDPHLGGIQKVDVTVFLANALAAVHEHLEDFFERVDIEVSIDAASGDLAGIVFFSEEGAAISVIRPHYLERDELECPSEELLALAQGPLNKLEAKLNQLFKQR